MNLAKSAEYFHPSKDESRVHIVGCGSVGSTVAENLARSGVTKFTLWDFDYVESHNIVNQMFRDKDIGKTKVEALRDIILEINPDAEPDIILQPDGWKGKLLSGYIFLCVDSIDVRREIVQKHMDSPYVKAVFDFRTRLEDAQHYAADWSDAKQKEDLLNSMDFTHEEAVAETPVSACNITLGVCPTVRIVCAYGVANYMNFVNGKKLRKLVLADAFGFETDAV